MKKKQPLVTVFMAAYNAERYIAEAIKSILNQTFTDYELLIANDGSTDKTLEIINNFQDKRIRIISNDTNRGLLYTRNVALKEAKGKLIAIMDSDDFSLPDRLLVQVTAFKKDPSLALYGGQAKVIDEDGKEIGKIQESETCPELLKIKLLFQNTFVHSSMMIRTAVFKEMGGYQEPFAEDYDLFLRIAHRYRVANGKEFIVLYRSHGDNVSNTVGEKIMQQLLPVKGKLLARLGYVPDPDFEKILTNPYIWPDVPVEKYKILYTSLIIQNRRSHILNPALLENYIFQKWYEVIMMKGGINTVVLFFSNPIFQRELATFKQVRKTFKRSIKKLFIRK